MAQIIRPPEDRIQNTEELGSAPPQTEPLANNDPSAKADGPADYSTGTTETVQAEIPADTAMSKAPETVTLVMRKTPELPWYRTTAAKIGAGAIAALSLLGIGTAIGSGGDSSDKKVTTGAPAAEGLDVERELENAPTEIYDPSKDDTVGNINPALLEQGTPYIETIRPNGEKIKVPKLPDASDPQKFGEAAVALLAAYYTTGDFAVLEEFTDSASLQQTISDHRKELMADFIDVDTQTGGQLVAFDKPGNPAVFKTGIAEGKNYIYLASGELYMKRYIDHVTGDNEWQTSNAKDPRDIPEYTFTGIDVVLKSPLLFRAEHVADGSTTVRRIDFFPRIN